MLIKTLFLFQAYNQNFNLYDVSLDHILSLGEMLK